MALKNMLGFSKQYTDSRHRQHADVQIDVPPER